MTRHITIANLCCCNQYFQYECNIFGRKKNKYFINKIDYQSFTTKPNKKSKQKVKKYRISQYWEKTKNENDTK